MVVLLAILTIIVSLTINEICQMYKRNHSGEESFFPKKGIVVVRNPETSTGILQDN